MYNLFVFFLLLAACGKTVLCETCSESVRPQQSCTRARHMFVLNEIDPFFTHGQLFRVAGQPSKSLPRTLKKKKGNHNSSVARRRSRRRLSGINASHQRRLRTFVCTCHARGRMARWSLCYMREDESNGATDRLAFLGLFGFFFWRGRFCSKDEGERKLQQDGNSFKSSRTFSSKLGHLLLSLISFLDFIFEHISFFGLVWWCKKKNIDTVLPEYENKCLTVQTGVKGQVWIRFSHLICDTW